MNVTLQNLQVDLIKRINKLTEYKNKYIVTITGLDVSVERNLKGALFLGRDWVVIGYYIYLEKKSFDRLMSLIVHNRLSVSCRGLFSLLKRNVQKFYTRIFKSIITTCIGYYHKTVFLLYCIILFNYMQSNMFETGEIEPCGIGLFATV